MEAALLRRFKNEDALAGVGRLSGRLAGPFGHVGVEVQLTPDRKATSIYLVPKQSHPGHQQALDAYCARLAQDPQGMPEFDFTPTYRHEPRRVAAALYHAAYLLLFSYFGYEVAFHPNFKLVRTQILRPDEEILPTTFPLLDEASVASALGPSGHAVLLPAEPPIILAALRFRPKGGIAKLFGVILPGLDEPGIPAELPRKQRGLMVKYMPQELLRTNRRLHLAWRLARQVRDTSDPSHRT